MIRRIKLFSDYSTRKKLFSSNDEKSVEYNEGGIQVRTVICKDCGHTMETAESTSRMCCPNCGGKRFDIAIFRNKDKEAVNEEDSIQIRIAEEQIKNRKSVVENHLTPFENKLKKFSGTTMDASTFEKTFSDKTQEMLEKGFAVADGYGNIQISPSALATEKLFSKLIISVTKTLVLDPEITRSIEPKEAVIERLEEHLPEKGIMLIKKAHAIPEQHIYCDNEPTGMNWVEDSRIVPDLELEYSNQSFPIEKFIKIIRERYPDSPENILDLLSEVGVIRLEGTQVTVQSNSKK